jgi:hypothetical protein
VGRRGSICQFVFIVASLWLAGCGGHAPATSTGGAATVGGSGTTATPAGSRGASGSTSSGMVTATASRPSSELTPRRPRPDPCPPRTAGALPQTERVPSATTPCFHAIVRALWRGVRSASYGAARYAFFPLKAYVQVKAVGDPAVDYRDRLVAEYDLDLVAAHELLAPAPKRARLLRVIVPRKYVHWVPPGACDNRFGYYEVPNSRLVYRVGDDVRSFAIASLISWRGIWYVVHLGAVTRSGYSGVIDDPSDGTGTPTPSLTC